MQVYDTGEQFILMILSGEIFNDVVEDITIRSFGVIESWGINENVLFYRVSVICIYRYLVFLFTFQQWARNVPRQAGVQAELGKIVALHIRRKNRDYRDIKCISLRRNVAASGSIGQYDIRENAFSVG
jgi:hypothetical protein